MGWTDGMVPIKGLLTIVGGIFIHITLGTQLTFGNTNPYLVSYIRNSSSPADLKYIDGIWVQACMLMGQGVSMFVGGVIEVKLGPRLAALIGSWFLSAGVLLTYVTVKASFIATVITYGVMFGLGCGASYAVPVGAAMRWFPKYRGFVSGVVFFGFGMGSVIFNQVITVYINPDNISPDLQGDGDDKYFSQPEILERVPTLFLILGGTYAALQLIAFFLISDPPHQQTAGAESKTDSLHGSDETVWTTTTTASSVTTTMTTNVTNEDGLKKKTTDNVVDVEKDSSDDFSTMNDETEEAEMEIRPLRMLRTPIFYCMWTLFLLGGLGGVFLISQYKAYGQTFISDDRFFSIVGSCASALNAISGIIWGWVADRYTCKTALQMLLVTFSSAAYTMSAAEDAGKAFYLIWVCLVFFCNSGIYGIMPSAIGRIYGNKYISINYGITYSSQILTAAISAFVGQQLIEHIGYHGLFYVIGGALTISLLIVIRIQPRSPDGKNV